MTKLNKDSKLSEEMKYFAYRLCGALNTNDEKGYVIKAWSECVAELEQENKALREALDRVKNAIRENNDE